MGRGGKRKGAGRPKGTGKFGEATKAVRLPVSMIDQIMHFIKNKGFIYPFYSQSINPARLSQEPRRSDKINLAESMGSTPASTFVIRVEEDAMAMAGILPGDLVIINSSLKVENDDIVLAVIDDQFVLRRFIEKSKGFELKSGSAKAASYKFGSMDEVKICGVVKQVIRELA